MSAWSPEVLALLVGAGLLVAYRSSLGKPGLALAGGIPLLVSLILLVPLPALAVVVVISTQLTAGRFPLGGYHFLPEHVALLAFGGALLVRSPGTLLRRAAPYEALLLGWIAWNLVVSLLYSPERGRSLAVVGWMALAWLVLWCLRGYFLAEPEARDRVLHIGAWVAALIGAVSFGLWAVALVGGPRIGVQPEFVTGTLAGKGPALEANFLGIQELCWLFLALRGRVLHGQRLSPWQVSGMLLGIVASMTRAVWIAGLFMVCGAFIVSRRRDRADVPKPTGRRPATSRALAAGAAMTVLLVTLGGPAADKFKASLDFGSETAESRVANWKLGWGDITDSGAFLTGLGTNSFGQRHLSRTLPGEPDYLGNLPLTVLYDAGVVGVVLFAAAMASIALRARAFQGRLLNALFVLTLLIVGTATSPVWFGFIWLTVAALDSDPVESKGPLDPAGVAPAPSQAVSGSAQTVGR